MKRALFISYSMPPMPESQCIRNAYLCRGLAAAGYEITIITSKWSGGDASLLELLPPGVRIIRRGTAPYDKAQSLIGRLPAGRVRSVLKAAFAVSAGRVLAPDVRAGWTGAAVDAAREAFGAAPPDVIVSASGSCTAHLAAAQLVDQWKRPWVAELGDPWSFNPLKPLSTWPLRAINARLERAAFERCSVLSVTTPATAKAYQEWFGSDAPRVVCVPSGWDEDEWPDPTGECDERAHNSLLISYVGTASKGSRSLIPAITALQSLGADGGDDTVPRLRIVGDVSGSFAQAAAGTEMVEIVPPVTYAESVEEIRRADLLLLIGNAGRLQVPLKAAYYLASGKPILYIAQQDESTDPTWELLREYGGVVRTRNNVEALTKALHSIVVNYPSLREEACARREHGALSELRWSAVGAGFARELAAAVPRSR